MGTIPKDFCPEYFPMRIGPPTKQLRGNPNANFELEAPKAPRDKIDSKLAFEMRLKSNPGNEFGREMA